MALSGRLEVLLRVPFLVLLEWLLCLDIKQYSDLVPYGRIFQLTGELDVIKVCRGGDSADHTSSSYILSEKNIDSLISTWNFNGAYCLVMCLK